MCALIWTPLCLLRNVSCACRVLTDRSRLSLCPSLCLKLSVSILQNAATRSRWVRRVAFGTSAHARARVMRHVSRTSHPVQITNSDALCSDLHTFDVKSTQSAILFLQKEEGQFMRADAPPFKFCTVCNFLHFTILFLP